MPVRILVIEDDPSLLELLRYNLEAEGYTVATADAGDPAKLSLAEELPDLIILDWMLPDISGIELCGQLRRAERTARLPVILLTARGEEADRVRGLTTGADDYIVKPFSVPELLARVKGLLRRISPERIEDVLVVGAITLDRTAHRVHRGTREVTLGPTEYRLLEALMESHGRVLTRSRLLDLVWGSAAEIDDRTVDVHVGRLRKAIVQDGETDPIRTVRGTGYALEK
jgi:two-component system phosphate regulon response regulator PhoB